MNKLRFQYVKFLKFMEQKSSKNCTHVDLLFI
jgi:hypothetical protein